MSERELDHKIKDALHLQTEEILLEKKRIKRELERTLFGNEVNHVAPKRKPQNRRVAVLAAVAAAALLSVGLQTEPGYALVDQIRQLFAPEKQVTQTLEGTEETVTVSMNESVKSDYVIYVDETMYTYTQSDEADTIKPNQPLGDAYPEVSMEISQALGTDVSSVVADLAESLEAEGLAVSRSEAVTFPRDAHMLLASTPESVNEVGKTGPAWNDPVHRYYVFDGAEGEVFIIKQKFFSEAAEGHGGRFDEMVKEFRVTSQLVE